MPHIATKTDQVVKIDPLEYRLRSVDSRLVMRIYNPTEDPIELLGPRSSVVDSEGQSHPLRSQTIAPQSFIKLIFPPPRPRVYDSGPRFGIGVGIHSSAYPHHRYRRAYLHDEYDPEPRYFVVYDDNDTSYWDWRGAGEARVILATAAARRNSATSSPSAESRCSPLRRNFEILSTKHETIRRRKIRILNSDLFRASCFISCFRSYRRRLFTEPLCHSRYSLERIPSREKEPGRRRDLSQWHARGHRVTSAQVIPTSRSAPPRGRAGAGLSSRSSVH